MGFIPVDFGLSYCTIGQANAGDSFQLAPPSWAELLLQPHDVANVPPNGDGLDVLDLSDDIKGHGGPFRCYTRPRYSLVRVSTLMT